MAYCTLDDLKKYLPEEDLVQLTDDAGTGAIDPAKTAEAIAAADALIEGYTRGRYVVPFDPVPDLIRQLSARLTLYELFNRKQALKVPDQIRKTYEDQLNLLDRLRKGEVTLNVTAVSAGGVASDYRTSKTDSDRIFTKTTLDRMP